MIPGPDQVVACPRCEAEASYSTMISGNNFGARYWTDGRMIAPMLVETPAIVKCPSCGHVFWLADAREVREEPFPTPESIFGADGSITLPEATCPSLAQPTESEYYAALAAGLARNTEEERAARMLAWWRRNDALRGDEASGPPPLEGGAWRVNLEALLGLLDTDDDRDRMARGEILRQLGRFDEASRLLEQIREDGLAWAVKQVRAHCEKRDAELRELLVER
jgi:hypothetical protein